MMSTDKNIAKKYRNEEGGHLLFRPIGLLVIIRCVRSLRAGSLSVEEAVYKISKVPMTLSEDPWANLLWDPVNKRKITSPENQKAAERLLYYAVGGKLSDHELEKLKKELAGLLNKEIASIHLPKYV